MTLPMRVSLYETSELVLTLSLNKWGSLLYYALVPVVKCRIYCSCLHVRYTEGVRGHKVNGQDSKLCESIIKQWNTDSQDLEHGCSCEYMAIGVTPPFSNQLET